MLAALLLLSCARAASPADVRRLSVDYENREFVVSAELGLGATPSAVFRVLTDYTGWRRLNGNIMESRVLAGQAGAARLVHSVTRACLAFFCRNIEQMQMMATRGDVELVAVTVPAPGHLRRGRVHWLLEAEGRGTRVRLWARLAPDFWLPPLIGPWSIKTVLKEQVLETAANLERLAASGG